MSDVRDVTADFVVEDAVPSSRPHAEPQRETDPHRLAQRQKQIDMGKNTLGYQRYRQAVPREKRNRKTDPITPNVYQVCSKRAFEGQVKKWRRMLHSWDPPGQEGGEPALLPVVADLGPAANPAPPAADQPDDFEHISHGDAASPKNGGAALARPAGSQLPLKLPSAVRKGKRSFDEALLAGGNENQPPQQGQQQAQQQHCSHLGSQSAQPARGAAPGAKHQRRSTELPVPVPLAPAPGGRVTPQAAPAAPPKELSWSEQRYGQPQLDYGDTEDEDDWQHVSRDETPAGRYHQVVYNNPVADEAWNEEDIQV
ncbi:hypothetical protein ABPG75_010762 [Micractinium tetrahymenae]